MNPVGKQKIDPHRFFILSFFDRKLSPRYFKYGFTRPYSDDAVLMLFVHGFTSRLVSSFRETGRGRNYRSQGQGSSQELALAFRFGW